MTYVYCHLLTGKYELIKKQTLKLYKELSLSLTGIWLSKMKILITKSKHWMKLYWRGLTILFSKKKKNLALPIKSIGLFEIDS